MKVMFFLNKKKKPALRVIKYILLSFLLSSFWILPLFLELNYSYHESYEQLIFDFLTILKPKDLNCDGLCPINSGFYLSIVLFSGTILGLLMSIFRRKNFHFVIILTIVQKTIKTINAASDAPNPYKKPCMIKS